MNPRHYIIYKRSGARQFIVLDKGARLMWEPQEWTPLLLGLPKLMKEKICRYAALAPEGITIDITAGKTCNVSTDFKRFCGLNYLLYPDAMNNGIISNIAGGNYGCTCDQSLNLNFMLGRRKDHEDIQINIKGLVRFLSSLPLLKSNTRSIINIKLYEKQGPYRAKIELPIKKQRKAIFLFFTDFL
ncbi:uncharacterized protein ALTATR162_LOCUS406 [Alternaria atra]|uniref:Uncharacterized protein n=1 Tax=Alternaria atra TaxID=119953 RepID=A0A8J2HV76_9PLEO|nr:uncharacterized protein ALTATR162_LOCUS406 [Alternaria atra]CAG5138621.1 unnamed protein product [Alternaria atra]